MVFLHGQMGQNIKESFKTMKYMVKGKWGGDRQGRRIAVKSELNAGQEFFLSTGQLIL